MHRLIRSSVETPHATDVLYEQIPDTWDDMTEAQREEYCTEVADTHLGNVVGYGASAVDVDDAELARIRRDGLIVE